MSKTIRNIILSIVWMVASINIEAGTFIVKGVICNIPDTSFINISYLKVRNGLCFHERIDSIPVIHGHFRVEGDVPGLTPGTIEYGRQRVRLYLEPNTLTITMDANNPRLFKQSGSSVDEEISQIHEFLKESDSILYASYNAHSKGKNMDWFSAYLEACYNREDVLLRCFEKYRMYQISPDLLIQALSINRTREYDNLSKIKDLRNLCPDNVKYSRMGELLDACINQASRVALCRQTPIGSKAPDFIGTTMSGDTVQLSLVKKDKPVLLCFFTSYAEQQVGVEDIRCYVDDYEERKYQYIGIDIQDDPCQWKKYLSTHSIPYPVIKDYWDEDLYHVWEWTIGTSYPGGELPSFFIIDQDGKIVENFRITGDKARLKSINGMTKVAQ